MSFNPRAYLDTFKDIRLAYKDLSQKGKYDKNKGAYRKTYNKGLGNEQNWLDLLEKSTGRKGSDVGEFTDLEFARAHYDTHGSSDREKRTKQEAYKKNLDPDSYAQKTAALQDLISTGKDPGNAKDLLAQLAEQQYGTSSFDQEQFDTLLGKLTGSKMKQQRQKSVEGRRDIYATGLANMMRNF